MIKGFEYHGPRSVRFPKASAKDDRIHLGRMVRQKQGAAFALGNFIEPHRFDPIAQTQKQTDGPRKGKAKERVQRTGLQSQKKQGQDPDRKQGGKQNELRDRIHPTPQDGESDDGANQKGKDCNAETVQGCAGAFLAFLPDALQVFRIDQVRANPEKEADHDHVGGQRKIQRPGVLYLLQAYLNENRNARDQPQQGQAR